MPHDDAPSGPPPGVDAPASADRVLAVIPAYEAADLLGPVVREAVRHLPVLVVDDGSTDDTAGVAAGAGAEVIRQEENRGKGAALKRAFHRVLDDGCDAVVTLDADGQHDPVEIPGFLGVWRAERPDLVIGARDFSEMPPVRRLANTIGRLALSRAVGRDIPDNQSGYRLLSRRLILETLESGESGFEFEVEMVLICLRLDWPIAWVPIRTIYEGQGSHISPTEHALHFFRMVWRARRAARSDPRPATRST